MKKVAGTLLMLLGTFALLAGSMLGQGAVQFAPNSAPASFSGWSDVQQFALWGAHSTNSTSAGAASMQMDSCYFPLAEGPQNWFPLAVGQNIKILDPGSGLSETVAITGVSTPTLSVGAAQPGFACSFTATFLNAHTSGVRIISADGGLGQALSTLSAQGGTVALTPGAAITNANITAAVVYPNVNIVDIRGPQPQYWNPTPGATTYLAAPATLTATTVGFGLNGANTTGGTYTGASTYHVACAYVDVMGQVGPESADFSALTAGTGTTNQIGIAAPAASPGAVGYVCYISLAGGTYSLDYEVPVTSLTCNPTQIETVTPACAVANSTYGQTGSNLIVSALTLSTSPVGMVLGGVSGTLLTGNPNGRTTYVYAPSNHSDRWGLPAVSLPFTVAPIGSATPVAIGTVNIGAGVLNFVGNELRVCGKLTNTDVNSTVQNINIYLDAAGSDTAGSPVQIASLAATAGPGTAATYTGNFCWQGHTSVSGAGATAGSIFGDYSTFNYYLSATPAGIMVGGDTKTAAVASLNLAGGGGFENRLSIVHTNTTGNNTPQLQNLTLEVLN